MEPFVNGVAKLLVEARAYSLNNVRIFTDDARLLLRALIDDCIGTVYILFPDPWPKNRHRKRRIVNGSTVRELARVMRVGSELRLATDDADYGREILADILSAARFRWLAERALDWRCRPADWPNTRYEAKALAAGRSTLFLRFQRC